MINDEFGFLINISIDVACLFVLIVLLGDEKNVLYHTTK